VFFPLDVDFEEGVGEAELGGVKRLHLNLIIKPTNEQWEPRKADSRYHHSQ
jgi:hypothetical protein